MLIIQQVYFCINNNSIRNNNIYTRKPVKDESMFFFHSIMSLGGSGFAVLLTGFGIKF